MRKLFILKMRMNRKCVQNAQLHFKPGIHEMILFTILTLVQVNWVNSVLCASETPIQVSQARNGVIQSHQPRIGPTRP
ncbi:uncharacterized protein DS421_16g553830 [Arachis hypogaea]|nr:uncharacterized protein DS421_16g553830 [Arachis hypogaea]